MVRNPDINQNLISCCSVNHIQHVISESPKTFEIKKIEFEDKLASNGSEKSNIIMRLEFDGEVERDNWMEAIMVELKQLQSMSFSLSNISD